MICPLCNIGNLISKESYNIKTNCETKYTQCDCCGVEQASEEELLINKEIAQKAKRVFCEQYILNRALGNSGGLEGKNAAVEAVKAWNTLQEML